MTNYPSSIRRMLAEARADGQWHAYQADAAVTCFEVLAALCSRFDDADARRLLAEVCWWRDNAHRIPWLPPAGDGSRYRRMMSIIEPDFRSDDDEAVRQELRKRAGLPSGPVWRLPPLDASLGALLEPRESAAPAAPALVDWNFLDQDDGQPGEMPDWAKKQIKLFGRMMPPEHQERFRYSRPIPPTTPKRYYPDDGPPDLDDDDGEDLDWDDED